MSSETLAKLAGAVDIAYNLLMQVGYDDAAEDLLKASEAILSEAPGEQAGLDADDLEVLDAKADYVRARCEELAEWMRDEVMPRIRSLKASLAPSMQDAPGLEEAIHDYLAEQCVAEAGYDLGEITRGVVEAISEIRWQVPADALYQIEMGMEDWKQHGNRDRAKFALAILTSLKAVPAQSSAEGGLREPTVDEEVIDILEDLDRIFDAEPEIAEALHPIPNRIKAVKRPAQPTAQTPEGETGKDGRG